MNNNFTRISQIKIIREYNNGEYKNCIQTLKNHFKNVEEFEVILNECRFLEFRDINLQILQLWKLKENIDKIIKDKKIDINDLKSIDFNSKYVPCLFDKNKIELAKEKCEFLLRINILKDCISLYNPFAFNKLFNMIYVYFNSYEDYEKAINDIFRSYFDIKEISVLRKISYLYFYYDKQNTKYPIIKNLINVYRFKNTNEVAKYLKECNIFDLNKVLNDKKVIELFSIEDQRLLNSINKEYSKERIVNDYENYKDKNVNITDSIDVIMNILIQEDTKENIYYKLKYEYKYSPYKLEQALKSKKVYKIYNNKALVDFALFIKDYIYVYDSIKNRKKEEKNNEEINLIIDFINSNLSIDEYCSDEVEKLNLIRALERVKKKNPELYNRYRMRIIENKKSEESLLYELSQKVLDKIKSNPNFDIIEYLKMTSVNHSDLIRGYKSNKDEINKSDLMILMSFVNNNTKGDEIDSNIKEKLYDTKQTYIFTENGKEIYIEATREDKDFVFSELEKNPNLNYTRPYSLILKRRVKKRFTEGNY